MKSFLALLLLLAAVPFTGYTQEEKPKTLAEAKAEFAKADAELNAAYTETKKALTEYEFETLRKDQREWIEYRDARALSAVQFDYRKTPEGKEKESPHYWGWLKELTETRIVILRGWRGVGDEKTWTGRYIDGHGGTLELVQKERQFFFTLEVVRGPTYHLGNIAGTGKKNQNRGRFSDVALGDKEKIKQYGETWLTFESDGRWLTISGTNTQHYHGARAYFDGRYIRIATLTEEEIAKVEKNSRDPDWTGE